MRQRTRTPTTPPGAADEAVESVNPVPSEGGARRRLNTFRGRVGRMTQAEFDAAVALAAAAEDETYGR